MLDRAGLGRVGSDLAVVFFFWSKCVCVMGWAWAEQASLYMNLTEFSLQEEAWHLGILFPSSTAFCLVYAKINKKSDQLPLPKCI